MGTLETRAVAATLHSFVSADVLREYLFDGHHVATRYHVHFQPKQ
jgi:hypothetical protein